MTVSAADAAVPATPAPGGAGKRSAEGGDVFAALVAGLLGPLVAPEPAPATPGLAAPAAGDVAIDAVAPQLGLPIAAAEAGAGDLAGDQAAVPQPDAAPVPPAAATTVPTTAPAAPAAAAPSPAAAAAAPTVDVPLAGPRPEVEAATGDVEAPRVEELPDAPRAFLPEAPLTGGVTPQAQPAAVRDVAAVAPVVEARPSLPTAPAAQVAAVVAPVLQGPDGSYRVTMHLQPEALGHVAVTVDLHEGSVSLHLHAAESGTGDLLRDSLDELRSELDRQGLSMGTLDVSTGERGPGGRAARDLDRPATPAERRDPTPTAPAAPLAPSTSGRPSALDVQL